MQRTYMQAIRPAKSGVGVDVYTHTDGKLKIFRNVVENIARCALGRDYDYWASHTIRGIKELCRPLAQHELDDFANCIA
jgi:hypothetical protein